MYNMGRRSLPGSAGRAHVVATLVEVALLLYLFLWHRTSFALHHPWEWRVVGRRAALQHPMGTWLDPPQNPICPFGHAAIKVGAALLRARRCGRAPAASGCGRSFGSACTRRPRCWRSP